jgi:hypothetical protein
MAWCDRHSSQACTTSGPRDLRRLGGRRPNGRRGRWTGFLPIAPVLGQTRLAPYAAVVAPTHHQHDGYSQLRSRNALVDHLDADAAAVLAGLLDRGDAGYVQVRSVGGASRRPAAASASRPTTTRRR